MYIVNQDGTEIAPLNRLWLDLDPYGESCINHNLDSDHPSNVVAIYPTQEEAKDIFSLAIYWLRKGETVYEFPKPRTALSEPPKP